MSGKVVSSIKAVGEAVVKPVVDEVGQALEQGLKAVVVGSKQQTTNPVTQQQLDQRKVDAQKKEAEAKWIIDQYKKQEDEVNKIRQQKTQQMQAKQQEDQKVKEVKQFEIVQNKKETKAQEIQQKVSAEKRMSKGVGG